MTYNYLGLVNEVNRRINEVELTSSNFSTATGFYSTAKDAVNNSINHINQTDFKWPFNHREQVDTLVAGTMRYPIPYDAKVVDFDSFRIKRSATLGNKTSRLLTMDYEEYLDKCIDDEYNSDTSIRKIPEIIVRAPGNEMVVYPKPDKAYELVYEYYALPVDLELYTDVPTIPEFFKTTVVDGVMYYVYLFRGDAENTDRALQKFQRGVDNLRAMYINRYEYVRDTRMPHRHSGSSVLRVD